MLLINLTPSELVKIGSGCISPIRLKEFAFFVALVKLSLMLHSVGKNWEGEDFNVLDKYYVSTVIQMSAYILCLSAAEQKGVIYSTEQNIL